MCASTIWAAYEMVMRIVPTSSATLHHRLSSRLFSGSFRTSAPHYLDRSSSTVRCSSSVSMLREFQVVLNSPFLQEYGSLVGSFLPLGVAMLGCKRLGFRAVWDLAIAISRCSGQLLVLAFALKFVFEGEKIAASILAITFMVIVAGSTAGNRASKLPRSCFIATSSLACGTLGVLALMIVLKACPITPRHIIPTAGYVIGNSMSMVGSTMQELRKDLVHHKGQIEAALALGATPQQAVQSYIRRSVMQGMAPWIDSIKTAGLITIPGSMTGMLMVNMHPMDAVRMQVQLLYMLLGAAALSCAIASGLSNRVLFTKSSQLAVGEP